MATITSVAHHVVIIYTVTKYYTVKKNEVFACKNGSVKLIINILRVYQIHFLQECGNIQLCC